MHTLLKKATVPVAAGLTTLAVMVTVPALGQDTPGAKQESSGPPAQELRTCLTAHGQDVSNTDDYGLKRWIVEHQADPAARDALAACDVFFGEKLPPDGAASAPCVKPAMENRAAVERKARVARRSHVKR
ncbi:MAG: hypothetical protein QOF76_2576 [Solirubrobacteraceae bacterium]|jgi:hypothetical protein|nr:hypothetical protein [Solirubrobacteraceae bacterium]